MNRRTFLKLAGIGSLSAAAGCTSRPEKNLFSLVRAPSDTVTGRATWYASTCRECPAGCGILAKNREGRVIKVEGMPERVLPRRSTGVTFPPRPELRSLIPLVHGHVVPKLETMGVLTRVDGNASVGMPQTDCVSGLHGVSQRGVRSLLAPARSGLITRRPVEAQQFGQVG